MSIINTENEVNWYVISAGALVTIIFALIGRNFMK